MGQYFIGKTRNYNFLLMFNEGGRFFNFTIIRHKDGNWFGYVYLFGKRWHS